MRAAVSTIAFVLLSGFIQEAQANSGHDNVAHGGTAVNEQDVEDPHNPPFGAEVDLFLGLNDAVTYDAGNDNVAYGRPASQISTNKHGAERAVNNAAGGKINAAYSSCQVTQFAINPWWKVDLQQDRSVRTVRVTVRDYCCGMDNDLATVSVDDQVCAENMVVPTGKTGDFVCSPALTGSSVKVWIPGEQRRLQLAEVEVFEALDNEPSEPTNTICYDGTRYWSKPCSFCMGPGPTQCTNCSSTHAFVPWRTRNGVIEGACEVYQPLPATKDVLNGPIMVQQIPGNYGQNYSLLPSASSKWYTVHSGWYHLNPILGKPDSGYQMVYTQFTCRLSKSVICNARESATEMVVCSTLKSAQLAEVRYVGWDNQRDTSHWLWYKNECEDIGATFGTACAGSDPNIQYTCNTDSGCCCHVPLDKVSRLVQLDASFNYSPHELCKPLLVLL